MTTTSEQALSPEDIARIADTYHAWRNHDSGYEDVPGFCKSAALDQITTHDFVLTPGRYVGTEEAEEDDEPIDEKIKRLTHELYAEFKRGRELEDVIRTRLGDLR